MEVYIGLILPFAGEYVPTNFLPCDGRQLPCSQQYEVLYAVIGNNYGGTKGVNFNLPDLRGALMIGWKQFGASAEMQAPFAITQTMSGSAAAAAAGDATATVVGATASQGFTATPKMVPVTWMICINGLFPPKP